MEVKSIYDRFVDILCFGTIPHKITNPNIVTYDNGVYSSFTQMEISLRDCKIVISNTLNTEIEQSFRIFCLRNYGALPITFKFQPKTITFHPKWDRMLVEEEIIKIQKELSENLKEYKSHHILYKIRLIKKTIPFFSFS